jgi:predicted PurR-regulated permease PerM
VKHRPATANPTEKIDVWVRNAVAAGAKLLGIAAGFFLIWHASGAVMLLLTSIVAAAGLSAAADGISRISGIARQWALLCVFLVLALAIGIGGWFGGATLLDQFQSYIKAVRGVVQAAQAFVDRGAGGLFPAGSVDLSGAMPRFATVFNSAARFLAALSEAALNVVLIIFLAAFLAWQPRAYKAGLLRLVPPERRAEVGGALTRAGRALRMWIVGQSVSMLVVFAATLIALWAFGMPYAIVLALLSGILTFVPTIGPFIAGIAITLAGFSVSVTMGFYGLSLYVFIQFIETYLVTPFVQEEAVHLPPAATLGAQLIGGALFGGLGFAFAVPLAAALRALVLALYIEPMEQPARDTHGRASLARSTSGL